VFLVKILFKLVDVFRDTSDSGLIAFILSCAVTGALWTTLLSGTWATILGYGFAFFGPVLLAGSIVSVVAAIHALRGDTGRRVLPLTALGLLGIATVYFFGSTIVRGCR
jgi:hypothetical protein